MQNNPGLDNQTLADNNTVSGFQSLVCGNDPGTTVSRNGATLDSQADLNQFFEVGTNNKYTEINGNLTIIGNTGALTPSPISRNLSEITLVTGSLTVRNFDAASNLTTFSMPSLVTVGGNVNLGSTTADR